MQHATCNTHTYKVKGHRPYSRHNIQQTADSRQQTAQHTAYSTQQHTTYNIQHTACQVGFMTQHTHGHSPDTPHTHQHVGMQATEYMTCHLLTCAAFLALSLHEACARMSGPTTHPSARTPAPASSRAWCVWGARCSGVRVCVCVCVCALCALCVLCVFGCYLVCVSDCVSLVNALSTFSFFLADVYHQHNMHIT